MNNTFINHSIISEYPINYEKYPLARNAKFYEIELNVGDYLLIPKYWSHWIYSEPNTVAFSYIISDIFEIKNINNQLMNSMFSSEFYKDTLNVNFNLDEFKNNNLKNDFNLLLSETIDVSPVIKNKTFKKRINNLKFFDIKNLLLKNPNLYSYIGMNEIEDDSLYRKIPNFGNIYNEVFLNYRTFIWMNFDKPVNSGLHYDNIDSILHVVSGKKKVLLSSPYNLKFLYIEKMNMVE